MTPPSSSRALAALLRPRCLDLLVSSPALPLPAGSSIQILSPWRRFGPASFGSREVSGRYGAHVGVLRPSHDPDLDPDLSRLLLGWAPEKRPFSSCCPDTGRTQDEGVRAGASKSTQTLSGRREPEMPVWWGCWRAPWVWPDTGSPGTLAEFDTGCWQAYGYVLALGDPRLPSLPISLRWTSLCCWPVLLVLLPHSLLAASSGLY